MQCRRILFPSNICFAFHPFSLCAAMVKQQSMRLVSVLPECAPGWRNTDGIPVKHGRQIRAIVYDRGLSRAISGALSKIAMHSCVE
jgi:hypothetical protein